VLHRRVEITVAIRAFSRFGFQRSIDMAIRITKSSTNVFKDLGCPAGEAAHLHIRAKFMNEVIRTIRVRKLTQASAAKLFGVSQPRISDLKCGKYERFSIDALVEMLALSGLEIGVTTRQKRRASA
jgi:predicted XRE-type DNA-binding protein